MEAERDDVPGLGDVCTAVRAEFSSSGTVDFDEQLYAAIARDGGAQNMVDRMQTRTELYATIDYAGYEALDRSIVETVVPQGMPQREPAAV